MLDEPDAEGVLLEPLAAPLLLGVEDEPDAEGVLLDEGVLLEPLEDELLEEGALDEPPEAESFFVASDEALEDDDGELGVVALPDAEPDAEPDGELGVVVEPADEDEPEPGAVEVREALLPALSPHAATPRARETAAARIESFI